MSDIKNKLKDAFTGGSQANRKYLAFAKKAGREGFFKTALLFKATAEAENDHAHARLGDLSCIGETVEKLKAATSGETDEFISMYPKTILPAISEGGKVAEQLFRFANEVEKIHAQLYQKALDNIDHPQDVDCYYVCSACGNTVENEVPDSCSICGAQSKAFSKVAYSIMIIYLMRRHHEAA